MTNPLTHTQMDGLPADRQAVKALRHVLRRVQDDTRVAHLMGPGSQAYDLMTESLASLEGISAETVRKIYTGATMNAPDTRKRAAEHAEAERLIGVLDTMRESALADADREFADEESVEESVYMARQIGFAADMLRTYAAELALATPSPITNTILLERHTVGDTPAPVDEIVLIWLAEDTDDGRPWLGHIDAGGRWWFVDASIARNVTHWAHRPRAAK